VPLFLPGAIRPSCEGSYQNAMVFPLLPFVFSLVAFRCPLFVVIMFLLSEPDVLYYSHQIASDTFVSLRSLRDLSFLLYFLFSLSIGGLFATTFFRGCFSPRKSASTPSFPPAPFPVTFQHVTIPTPASQAPPGRKPCIRFFDPRPLAKPIPSTTLST